MGLLEFSIAYIEAMQSKGRRPETLRAYSRDLAAFFGHVGNVAPDDVTAADVESFLDRMSAEGKAIASIVRARDVLRAFWSWMRSQGVAASNPTELLTRGSHAEPGAGRRFRPAGQGASSDQISAVLAHLIGMEDRLVTALVAATGLPASDILGLRVRNVSFVNDRHPEMPGGVAVLKVDSTPEADRVSIVGDPDAVRALARQVQSRGPTELLFKVPMRTLQHRFRMAAKTAGLPDLTLRNVRRAASTASIEPKG